MPVWILWLGVAIAITLFVVGLVVTLRSERSLVDRRLEGYLAEKQSNLEQSDLTQTKSSALTQWVNERVATTNYGDDIARELARADLKLKSGEFIILMAFASVFMGLFSFFFFDGSWFFALIGAIFGIFIPRMFVGFKQAKRLEKFSDQLPDMLNLMVNGLRTGFSALQAMEAVSRELPSPISDEFRRVVQEMQLGVSMETALDNLQRRIASEDLDLAITAINIQREVGGNLAEILDTISHTVRERIRIKGEMRSITAQVKYSGRFLALMPVALGLALWGLNREYMMEFFQPPVLCGYLMLGVSGIMLVIGYFVLDKMSSVEI
ncbi:MAG: type II secretion system F family protein [Anaerolineales bacterium]|nr:type II secretion system F family protein [Anaerolineales bacterium]